MVNQLIGQTRPAQHSQPATAVVRSHNCHLGSLTFGELVGVVRVLGVVTGTTRPRETAHQTMCQGRPVWRDEGHCLVNVSQSSLEEEQFLHQQQNSVYALSLESGWNGEGCFPVKAREAAWDPIQRLKVEVQPRMEHSYHLNLGVVRVQSWC